MAMKKKGKSSCYKRFVNAFSIFHSTWSKPIFYQQLVMITICFDLIPFPTLNAEAETTVGITALDKNIYVLDL